MPAKTFYVTTPIYYVNDVPHIGHAYTTILADVLARYRRGLGQDVFFLTGTDEHGQKAQDAAAKRGIPPQQHCDELQQRFRDAWVRLNVKPDDFVRTTEPRHERVVTAALSDLWEKGEIYAGEYEGWYHVSDEVFVTEAEIEEKGLDRAKLKRVSEKNYFFKMGAYRERLVEAIESGRLKILPAHRRNEVLGFLAKGLDDLCISRPKSRLSWGIPLPFDDDYVTYVWFDALVNYISALEYLPQGQPAGLRYWPADVHLVGKDILTTHAVYWSTMLMALEQPLPKTIFAHGWWTVDGEKMSKSRGNVVDPNKMVDQFGADAFRYFLLREVPFGQDGDFSHSALVTTVNAKLANGIGNLLSRTLTMIERSCAGVIPERGPAVLPELKQRIEELAKQLPNRTETGFNALQFRDVLLTIEELNGLCDEYIDKSAPWKLAKLPEAQPQLHTVLNTSARVLRLLAVLLYPFMPNAAAQMIQQLGLSLDLSQPLATEAVHWDAPLADSKIQKGASLFPRIESKPQGAKPVSDTPASPQPTAAAPTAASAAPQSPAPATTPTASAVAQPTQITIDDFMKVQLKAAKVLAAERVPKSDKLLKLQVSLGAEQRQIVAGIGKKYEPEALVGKTIVIVANLKPAKLMGIESQGMVLAAGDSEVRGLATFAEDVEPGTKVK